MDNSKKRLRYNCAHSEKQSNDGSCSSETKKSSNELTKLKQKSYQLRLENTILFWKRKQILADQDNFKNHLREFMMSANSPTYLTSPIVENAGIMQAIEEFGLVSRGNQSMSSNLRSLPNRATSSTDIDEFAVTAAIIDKGLSL